MNYPKIGDYIRIKGRIGKIKKYNKRSVFCYGIKFHDEIDLEWCSRSEMCIFCEASNDIKKLIKEGDILEISGAKYEVVWDRSMDKLVILIPNRNQLEIRHCSIEYIFSKTGIEEFKNIAILTKETFDVKKYIEV